MNGNFEFFLFNFLDLDDDYFRQLLTFYVIFKIFKFLSFVQIITYKNSIFGLVKAAELKRILLRNFTILSVLPQNGFIFKVLSGFRAILYAAIVSLIIDLPTSIGFEFADDSVFSVL